MTLNPKVWRWRYKEKDFFLEWRIHAYMYKVAITLPTAVIKRKRLVESRVAYITRLSVNKADDFDGLSHTWHALFFCNYVMSPGTRPVSCSFTVMVMRLGFKKVKLCRARSIFNAKIASQCKFRRERGEGKTAVKSDVACSIVRRLSEVQKSHA